MIVENLPPGLLYALPQLGLIFIGIMVERHYVSRVTCFANSLALYVHVGTQANPGFWLGTYADLGLVLGLIGIVAYLNQTSLSTYYYTISLGLYSGLPVGFVIVSGDAWVWGLLIAVVITLLTANLSDFKLGYTKSMPGEVYSYAKNRTIIRSNSDLGYEVEIDLLDALLR
jgi:hypothetical protein